jgi:hypothetical protein
MTMCSIAHCSCLVRLDEKVTQDPDTGLPGDDGGAQETKPPKELGEIASCSICSIGAYSASLPSCRYRPVLKGSAYPGCGVAKRGKAAS